MARPPVRLVPAERFFEGKAFPCARASRLSRVALVHFRAGVRALLHLRRQPDTAKVK